MSTESEWKDRALRAESEAAAATRFRDDWYERDLPAMQRLAMWLDGDPDLPLPLLPTLVQRAMDRAGKAEDACRIAEAERDAARAEYDDLVLSTGDEVEAARAELKEAHRERQYWEDEHDASEVRAAAARAELERLRAILAGDLERLRAAGSQEAPAEPPEWCDVCHRPRSECDPARRGEAPVPAEGVQPKENDG